MALKSSREGLRNELVDYLGNLIINEKIQKDIVENINSFIKMDLLWTNASISEFAPQTISLDLSKYKFVYILFYRRNDDPSKKGNFLIKKGEGSVCVSLYGDVVIARHVSGISDNGVVFGVGTTSDIYMIPYQIYGVR